MGLFDGRVLVTGGAGFIGTNLVRRLLASGAEHVRVLDDLSGGREENLAGTDAELVIGSLVDGDTVAAAVKGMDAVVHLGALGSVPRSLANPRATHEANVDGTINVLEACRSLDAMPHVIYASSSSVYGANPTLPKHESLVPMPVSPYAVSKLAGEQYVLAYAYSYGLPVLPFRFFNVYGPYQPAGHVYAAAIPTFVAAALTGQPVPINGDGLQTRDFTYVGSLIDVLVDAVHRRVTSPTPVNLAFGARHSLLEVVALIGKTIGREVAIEHRSSRAGDVRDSQADNGALRTLFPAARPTPIENGLAATVDWMRAQLGVR